ncbi:MAG: YIP1 family protein [Burkholderiales bacterium]|nr:YIP1 family protein [Burkholderiales bacterium]
MQKSSANMARRLAAICFSPRKEWDAIAGEPDSIGRLCWRYILPFSLIAPLSTMIGMRLFDGEWDAGYGYFVPAARIVPSAIGTFVISVLTIFMLAATYWLLAGFYDVKRNYLAALKVAVYGAIPVWISGVFLFLLPMIALSMAALAYSCVLYAIGLNRVMGVNEDNSAELAVLAILLVCMITVLLGSLASQAGLL